MRSSERKRRAGLSFCCIVTVCVGCGGRARSEEGEPKVDAGQAEASHLEASHPPPAALDATPDESREAATFDASEPGAPDADVRGETSVDANGSCGCEKGDFFIEARLQEITYRLVEPYVLQLHCVEDAPLVVDNCFGTLRLSACAGANRGAPCLYLAVGAGGFLLGHLLDENGAYLAFSEGTLAAGVVTGGARDGSFAARLTAEAGVADITGGFHVCASPLPECAP